MKKLVLLLDEWKNDRNFVGSELELIKKNFEVTIVCNDFSEKDKFPFPDDVNVYFYNRKSGIALIKALIKCFFDVDFYKEILNLKKDEFSMQKLSEVIRFYANAELFFLFLKDNKLIYSDAIYYSYWYFYKCFAITNHKKEICNSKIITRTHEYDLFTVSIPSGYQPFKYAMNRELDSIVFIAEQGRQYYLEKYGFNQSDKYKLYHLGTKNYPKRNPYEKQDKFVIASCSSVIERKRVGLIVEALSEINDINIEWIHFGTGDLFDNINTMCKDLLDKKANIVYELKGYTKHDDIMNYYHENSVDAFIMTAKSEGNPVSVMEAMSFGIPIISVNVCNMPNMVKGNGILTADDNASSISEAIREIANASESVISDYRNKSRQIWEEDYQEDANNERFVNEVLLKL